MTPIQIAALILFGGIAAVYLVDFYTSRKTAKAQRRLLNEKNKFYDLIIKSKTESLLEVMKGLNDHWCKKEIEKELKRREVNHDSN